MEDSAIIDLYFARAEDAIGETAAKYGAYLNQIAFRILRNRADTEEIVNDTYLGAWNAIPPARPSVLRHFLSRITRNLSCTRMDYLTAQRRNAHTVQLDEELAACIPDPRGLEETWEAQAVGESLNRYLATLDPVDCAVFLLRYYYAYTIAEIATHKKLPERRVKYLLAKTREGLKRHLEQEGLV